MSEWDAIRDLDEKESWIERTAVLSKDDHLALVQCAKEILECVVDELPIGNDGKDEYGFTDADFQSSAAQFDVDYLEQISAENTGTSQLSRQSLYVKFDPLVGTDSPKPVPTHQIPSDDLLMLDTPPPAGIKSCMKSGPTARKHVQIETTETLLGSPLVNSSASAPKDKRVLTLIDASPELQSELKAPESEADFLSPVVQTLPNSEPVNDTDYGFTDEDFQSSAAQFDVDYLEHISAENAGTSQLSRQSLYVKFDPLVGTDSPKPVPTHQIPSDDLLMLDTPPPAGIKSCMKSGPTARKHVQIETTETLLGSPLITSKTSLERPAIREESPLLDTDLGPSEPKDTTPQVITNYGEDPVIKDPSEGTLIQVLQYTEEDLARMKAEAVIQCRERVQQRKEAEMAELREQIAAAKKNIKKSQKRDNSLKSTIAAHDKLVSKLETEIQQFKERIEGHVERENEVLEHHEKCLKDAALVEERQTAIKEDMNKLEDVFEEAHKKYLALKTVHKKMTQQHKMMTTRKAEVLKSNAGNRLLVDRTRKDNKRLSAEIKASLDDTRKEIMAKAGLEKASQEKLQLDIESLKSDIELLDQENQQLSSMCEELKAAM